MVVMSACASSIDGLPVIYCFINSYLSAWAKSEKLIAFGDIKYTPNVEIERQMSLWENLFRRSRQLPPRPT